MSKVIKTLTVSAIALFGFFSAASHAENLRPIKGCGYEIFKGVDKKGTVLSLCLHSRGNDNFITFFANKQEQGTYNVSDAGYLNGGLKGVMHSELIAFFPPDTRKRYQFGTFKAGRNDTGELKITDHSNVRSLIMLDRKTLKIHTTINGHGLEDYGIARSGENARQVPANIIKAPSM